MGKTSLGIRALGVICGAVAPLLAATQSAHAQVSAFTQEATERGLVYAMPALPSATYGYGVGFVDLNGDGFPEAICLGKTNGQVGLFLNVGGGHFEDRSSVCGIPLIPNATSFAAADYDGDGKIDLVFTTFGAGIRLFHNKGDLFFTEETASSGLTEFAASKGCAWGDYDGDGWIDLYVCNYVNAIPNTSTARNRLWHNNGDGTFTNMAPQLGMDLQAYSFVAAMFDADQDGDLDIYVSDDRGMYPPYYQPNKFYRNDGGGMFTEIGQSNGAGVALFSMGLACGDLNGDGLPDLYCTNLPGTQRPLLGANLLLLQQPDGTFVQAQDEWGVSVHAAGWACIFWDFNNDTKTDLYVVNQMLPNILFMNTGTPPMLNVTTQAALGGPNGFDYSASVADVDGDGDLDLIQNNFGVPVRLYINHEGETRRWAKFRMVGERHDTQAIGATVRVTADGTTQMRQQIVGANGYLGQNDVILHFGMGEALDLTTIEVRWPNTGTQRTLHNYPVSKLLTLYPPSRLGDANGDGVIDQQDLSVLASAYMMPVGPGNEMLDFDGDGVIGPGDAIYFFAVCTGKFGDFDHNGVVNGADLGALLAHWGEFDSAFDLNVDGIVDGTDLAILLANWG